MDLTPYGFADEDEILVALDLDEGDHPPKILEAATRAANSALSWLETTLNRQLAYRVHRAPVVVNGTTVNDNTGVTGAGFLALKAFDDVVGAGMQVWTRIASITNDGALVLTKKATAGATVPLTFGSAAALVDGDDTNEIYAPEYPMVSLYRAAALDSTGAATDLNITGARIDDTGLIVLPNDTFPDGRRNIVLEYSAGYRRPTSTQRGSPEWDMLKRLQLRMTECFNEDERKYGGRVETTTIGPITTSIRFRVPEDVARDILPFVRR